MVSVFSVHKVDIPVLITVWFKAQSATENCRTLGEDFFNTSTGTEWVSSQFSIGFQFDKQSFPFEM